MIPEVTVMVRTEVPEFLIVVVDKESEGPDGFEDFVREMFPLKPSMLATVIVEVHEPGAVTVRNSGPAESWKSGPFTVTGMSTDCDIDPLVPVTVTE